MNRNCVHNALSRAFAEVLGLDLGVVSKNTSLLNSVPELDSLSAVRILTEIEHMLDITIREDELTSEVFESVESLSTFVSSHIQ